MGRQQKKNGKKEKEDEKQRKNAQQIIAVVWLPISRRKHKARHYIRHAFRVFALDHANKFKMLQATSHHHMLHAMP